MISEEVNPPYSLIFKEGGREILGTPSIMKPKNFEKRKTSDKWYDLQKDYGHLTDDYMSLKVQINNHI